MAQAGVTVARRATDLKATMMVEVVRMPGDSGAVVHHQPSLREAATNIYTYVAAD
eukprot:COSAG02_NODE_59998_length_272_cov_1.080925_1_plen_54_part_01